MTGILKNRESHKWDSPPAAELPTAARFIFAAMQAIAEPLLFDLRIFRSYKKAMAGFVTAAILFLVCGNNLFINTAEETAHPGGSPSTAAAVIAGTTDKGELQQIIICVRSKRKAIAVSFQKTV